MDSHAETWDSAAPCLSRGLGQRSFGSSGSEDLPTGVGEVTPPLPQTAQGSSGWLYYAKHFCDS